MKKHRSVKALGIVQAETSTGILNPLPAIVDMAHRYDALLIADSVTSLGGEEVDVDRWDVDVCYSATQKCLGAPPGLAPISLGPRAVKVLRERKTKVQSLLPRSGDIGVLLVRGSAPYLPPHRTHADDLRPPGGPAHGYGGGTGQPNTPPCPERRRP